MKPRFPAIALALVMPIALHAQEEANGPAQKPTRAIWIGSSSAEFDDLSFGGVNTAGFAMFSAQGRLFLSSSFALDDASDDRFLGWVGDRPLSYHADIRAARTSLAIGVANRPPRKSRVSGFLSLNYTAFSATGTFGGESFSDSDESFDLGAGAAVAISNRFFMIVQWSQASFDGATGAVLTLGLGVAF
jgi:hypothetical protein